MREEPEGVPMPSQRQAAKMLMREGLCVALNFGSHRIREDDHGVCEGEGLIGSPTAEDLGYTLHPSLAAARSHSICNLA